MSVSSKKGPILDPGLCRCCSRIKKCRILTSEYTYMGQKEIYADMIMDCFGILLSHTDDNMKDSGVCATCVLLIRQATEFKNQVLMCEDRFLNSKHKFHTDNDAVDNYEEIKSKLDMKLRNMKEEVDQSNHEDDSMDDTDNHDKQYANVVKIEFEAEEEGVETTSQDEPLSKIKKMEQLKNNVTEENKIAKSTKENKRKKSVKCQCEKKKMGEQDMICENTLTIIENSYVCPFNSKTKLTNTYFCYYCKTKFFDPETLRQHTNIHDPLTFKQVWTKIRTPKIDLTRIDCRLCDAKIDNLNEFRTHITKMHNKKMHAIANEFFAYRLLQSDEPCLKPWWCTDMSLVSF